MANLVKVAAVLEAFADYYEQNEREKTSATEATRAARIQKIAAAHLAAHGEEMTDVARQKLAHTDDASLDVVEELLGKQAGVVAPLGAGADPDPDTQPRTVKEAADAADERFKAWILGS
jgi:hypothetical protein